MNHKVFLKLCGLTFLITLLGYALDSSNYLARTA